MKCAAIVAGAVLLGAAWMLAASSHTMTAHMLAHMTAVAVAAPCLAFGVAGTAFDAAGRWPRLVAPLPMSLVELAVVTGWHLPAARAFAASSVLGLVVEQLSFAAAGVLLWGACCGALGAGSAARRAAAVVALLLATMHMTLLGALLALAPRPLYEAHGFAASGVSAALEDQQRAGVVMLAVGGASYLAGGVWLLGGLLRGPAHTAARRWS